MCEVTGLHLEFYQRDVTDGFRSQEVVNFAQKPENAVQPVIGLVYAHLHGGRRHCALSGFMARGPAARSIRAEMLGDRLRWVQ